MKKLLTGILGLLCIFLSAQDFRFGKVSEDELKKVASTIYPDAKAEILYNECTVTYNYDNSQGFKLDTEVHFRVKIYKKESDWNENEIYIYKANNNQEKIYGFKAFTYNLEDGKITKTPIEKNNIITEESDDRHDVQKFAFANVKDGSVIEWSYTKSSPFYWAIDTWYFQYDIPLVQSIYKAKTPEFFNIKEDFRQFVAPSSINKTSENGIDFKENVINISYKNVTPALKEPYLLNVNNFRPAIKLEISGITIPGRVYEDYTSTWDKISKNLIESSNFGDQLKPNNDLVAKAKELTATATDNASKIAILFNYVKKEFTFNQANRLYTKQNLRKVVDEKKGNSTELNFVLIQLLRGVGINANPAVLCTVSNGLLNPIYPSMDDLNHTITYVEQDGKSYKMDASEDFSEINILPFKDLNGDAVVILPDGKYKKINTLNTSISKVTQMARGKISPTGEISGKVNFLSNNYAALEKSDEYVANKEGFIKDIKDNAPECTVDEVTINEKNTLTNFNYSYTYTSEELAVVQGDKIIVDAFLMLKHKESPFKKEERIYPVQFDDLFLNTSQISLEIPEGYMVETVPEPVNMSLPDNAGNLTTAFYLKEKTVEVVSKFSMNKNQFSPEDYPAIRYLFDQRVVKENEKIILSKKPNP